MTSHGLPLQRSMELYRGRRWRTVFCVAPTAPRNTALKAASAGKWTILVQQKSIVNKGDVHLAILRDETFSASQSGGLQSIFLEPDAFVTGFGSMNGMAGGEGVCRVAGYVAETGLAARYSSSGLAGAVNGVSLSAPSDRSGFLPGIQSIGTRSGSQFAASGTSVASPQVARALAMALLSGKISDLMPQKVAQILAESGETILQNAEDMTSGGNTRLGLLRLTSKELTKPG